MSSTWLLVLTVFNLVVLSVLTIQVFLKLKEKKEDLRLAKGLQLLQNKISILQDLSDKTDHQVHKIVQVIDKKSGDIQTNIALVDSKIANVEGMLIRATEISKAFAQQMPPQNISDMQKTSLHVQAAKLANQGFTKEQIGDKVDLNPAEIDLIFKVNKDQLQFAEDQLPEWVGGMRVDNSELSAFGNLIKVQKQTSVRTTNAAVATQAAATAQAAALTQATLVSNVTSTNTMTHLGLGMPGLVELTAKTTQGFGTIINASSIANANGTSANNKASITPYVFKKIEPQKV